MSTYLVLPPHASGDADRLLEVAVAAHLSRYKGQSRAHTASDLHGFLRWCADHDINPLTATRAELERWVRCMQEVRRLAPSTVARRASVIACFYRTCVIDGIIDALARRARTAPARAGRVTHPGPV